MYIYKKKSLHNILESSVYISSDLKRLRKKRTRVIQEFKKELVQQLQTVSPHHAEVKKLSDVVHQRQEYNIILI